MPLIGEQAEMIFRMCDQGFLNACSVGFNPTKYEIAKDRMDDDDWWPPVNFLAQELLEWSICTIPANPDATIDNTQRAAVVEALKQAADDMQAAEALRVGRANQLRRAMLRAYG